MTYAEYHLTASRRSGRAASTNPPPRHTYPALTAYVAERRRRRDATQTTSEQQLDPSGAAGDAQGTSAE